MLRSGIYQIVGPNDKVYIGQARNILNRFTHHRWRLKTGVHTNLHLQNAWNKYGPESFRFEPLAYFPIEDLDGAEQAALDSLPADRKYNIAIDVSAPARGYKHTEESKRKISEVQKGHSVSEAVRKAVSEAQRGRKMSPENRARHIARMTGRIVSPKSRARMSITMQIRRAIKLGTTHATS